MARADRGDKGDRDTETVVVNKQESVAVWQAFVPAKWCLSQGAQPLRYTELSATRQEGRVRRLEGVKRGGIRSCVRD